MELYQKKKFALRAIWETIVDTPDNEYECTDKWVKVTSKKIPSAHANGIFRFERDDLSEKELNELVKNEIEFYRLKDYNFRWKTCELSTPSLESSLLRNGMILKDLLYGFCITHEEMEVKAFHEGNEVFELNSERYEDWLVIQRDGWNVPAKGLEFLRKNKEMYLSKKNSKVFISYHKGVPGGAASYVQRGDYAFLVGGAVVTKLRGKGLYKDLISSRFKKLKKENTPAVIHCVSTTSAPIIQRLGFKHVCEIKSFELPDYYFRPLTETDFSLIKKWLKEPHVKEFWDSGEDFEESYENYVLKTNSDTIKQFLVIYQNRPIGYIQFYWASKVGDGWWQGYPENVVGIDQYIGEVEFIGKGHGTKMITEFCNYLKNNYKITKIITDPSPKNLRAIKCYEKVGFKAVGEIDTPDGKAFLMEYEV